MEKRKKYINKKYKIINVKLKMEEETFGLHQTLDCYKCDEDALDNYEIVSEFLDTLPEKIKMNKISKPLVIRCGGVSEKDQGGISGFVMIAESHISIHTFPNRRFMTMDVYSCNKFDAERVKEIVTRFFSVGKFEENIIRRGKEFKKLATTVAERR